MLIWKVELDNKSFTISARFLSLSQAVTTVLKSFLDTRNIYLI